MLGPSGAGKSNLVSRFINDKFNAESEVTIGVDFASKVMETFDGVKVKTQVWDTGAKYNSAVSCLFLLSLTAWSVWNVALCSWSGTVSGNGFLVRVLVRENVGTQALLVRPHAVWFAVFAADITEGPTGRC
jgi:hypothetical protein